MQSTIPKSLSPKPVSSNNALWGGIAFSLLFTLLIWVLGDRLNSIKLAPDTGAEHYYWKLPEPTFWTRASVWGLYLLHQVAIWWTIWHAQTKVAKYTSGLHRINVIALGLNALFIFLHLLQTHFFYDGLAQDVSIFSSQGSVIVLLVMVLIMENKRRGMFFGKKAPLSSEVVDFLKKHHGYFFSWAIVYTFWYHPTVNTPGHLVGFVYMFLLLLQGSLFFTRAHVNRWWTFVLEFSVLVHGTLVAVMQGNGIWAMFAFGFAGILVVTQLYGLKIPQWSRYAILGVYCAAVLFVYSDRGWGKLNEIIRIPAIDYLLVFVLTGLIWLGIWIAKKINPKLSFTSSKSDVAFTSSKSDVAFTSSKSDVVP
jgi:hypothetical protein